MKKPFIYIGILVLALAIPSGVLRAEKNAVYADIETKPASVTATAETPVTPAAPLTLAERKLAAETTLRDIASKLTLFTTRTQVALDRLASKGIDTSAAQVELTATSNSLSLATTNLDLFAGFMIVEGTDTTLLKDSLKIIEINLADARTHLIASLVALKVAVSIQ